MRSYVFTRKEREVISAYLRGEIRASDDIMRQVFVRMRSFKGLSSDVDLYLTLSKRITESKPT